MSQMEMRVCKDCHVEQPIKSFRTINRPESRSWTCNRCVYLKAKERGTHCWYTKSTENKEAWNQYQRRYKSMRYWTAKLKENPSDEKALQKLKMLNEQNVPKQ